MNYLKNVKFITSIFNLKDLPNDNLPIIGLVGKSNVGKSSLINALANNNKIAKTSNTPR